MNPKIPFNEQETKKINEIMNLPADQQKTEWEKFSKNLNEEQLRFLMQGGRPSGSEGCIFCKIASGEIPAVRVYEDETLLGILDIHPAGKGHTLLFPKKHHKTLAEIKEEDAGRMFIAASKLGKKMMEKLGCEGWNVFAANGIPAGQKIEHFLLHVIPRRNKDGLEFNWKGVEIGEGELEKIGKEIRVLPVSFQKEDRIPKVNIHPRSAINPEREETFDELEELERIP
jgi:histidine triad (HIT) family protein